MSRFSFFIYKVLRKLSRIIFRPELDNISSIVIDASFGYDGIESKLDWYIPGWRDLHVYLNKQCYDADYYLFDSKLPSLRLLPKIHRSASINSEAYSLEESSTWYTLYHRLLDQNVKSDMLDKSKNRFASFLDKMSGIENGYCFLTGPSLANYKNYEFKEHSLKIICNSIVKDKEFVDYIGGVDLLVFADPVYHFGYNEYTLKFWQEVKRFLRENPCPVIVPDHSLGMVLKHFPDLEEFFIGMPMGQEICFPTIDDFRVKSTANILTLFMLPIASRICKNVYLLGADGRSKKDKFFWSHSPSAQFNIEMKDVMAKHPSFFRDRNYIKYQKEHDRLLEEMFSYGEFRGIRYYGLNKSFLKSVAKRYLEV